MNIDERVAALREEMEKEGITALVVPSDDPHKSEYVAGHWKLREWISGFTGSAGTAVITMDQAGLWTDSRYFIQAEEELEDSQYVLHKMKQGGDAPIIEWLAGKLEKGATVGLNGLQFSPSQVKKYKRMLGKAGVDVRADLELVGRVWADRPPLPDDVIFEADPRSTGRPRGKKLEDIRKKMKEKGVDYHLVATLDDIAWVLNLRGSDVTYNPVFMAFLLIGLESCLLFTDEGKVPSEIENSLGEDGIDILPYDEIYPFLTRIPPELKVLADPSAINYRLYGALSEAEIVEGDQPSRLMKAVKNSVEIAHIKQAMVKDGVALTQFYRWLEKALGEGRTPTEAELADKLAEYRGQQEGYHGESFGAIVGFKGNGAIVHYRPLHGKSAEIEGRGLLLIDSGGQYEDGTTDITRTICIGEPTSEEKKAYTLVLKGHIGLAQAVFPEGTHGVQLDILARQHLWNEGMNYGHGTGHGVGFFLNVHEPPQGFVPGLGQRGTTVFKPGMFTSNEPGFYKEGAFGIRIENLVLCMEHSKTDSGRFYRFDTLTLFPIDTTLIDNKLMTTGEIKWLNDYHRLVFEQLSPKLDDEEREWLEARCVQLTVDSLPQSFGEHSSKQ